MILIGSAAIKHWFPEFPREPKDLDYIGQGEVIRNSDITIEVLRNPVFDGYPYSIMKPDDLYTLKISHMFWDINWEKHMFDVQFLRKKGCQVNKELFYKLYEHWNTYHPKNKRSDLKMSADDFFDNAVKCDYYHDDLHTILNPTPTYTKVLIGEVEVGEEKFNSLSHEEKCALVTEEVMVMAWERYHQMDYRHAYSRMLKKFIISHAPLWEAVFIIENYIELHKPKFNYFKTIEDGLQTIKRTA
jgi:hypothetical protein